MLLFFMRKGIHRIDLGPCRLFTIIYTPIPECLSPRCGDTLNVGTLAWILARIHECPLKRGTTVVDLFGFQLYVRARVIVHYCTV